jgi:hypothetical protein
MKGRATTPAAKNHMCKVNEIDPKLVVRIRLRFFTPSPYECGVS